MQSYTNISEAFLSFDLKSFIKKFSEEDPAKLALSYKPRHDFDTALLFDQILLHKKALKKLPEFAKYYCFFTRKSLEQASSEELARYKSALFAGKLLLDLSGGLGVDDCAFAKNFDQVISVDKDAGLNKLVRRNFDLMGITNITRIDGAAEAYLNETTICPNLVYLDADRRTAQHKAVHLFDGEPDIPKVLEMVKPLTTQVLLKLSPLIDLDHIQKHLSHIQEIHVVSLKNEVKEVLVWINWQFDGPTKVIASDISGEGKINSYSTGKILAPEYGNEGLFFFEPALCLIKADLTAAYAADNNLKQIGELSQFYVADQLSDKLMGRGFQIRKQLVFGKSAAKEYLRDKHITKANISRRHFPSDVNELYRLLGIKEGGEDYLFFTTDGKGTKLMYHCVKPGSP